MILGFILSISKSSTVSKFYLIYSTANKSSLSLSNFDLKQSVYFVGKCENKNECVYYFGGSVTEFVSLKSAKTYFTVC